MCSARLEVPYLRAVREELAAYGFEVTVEAKEKTALTLVESAFIKADTTVYLLKVGSRLRTA